MISKNILEFNSINSGQVGFASGLNFVIVVINIVLFFLNFLTVTVYRIERLYSVIGTILFIIAFVCMVWFVIEYAYHREQLIVATVFIGIQMVLFIWDYKILHGEAYN
uniref:MARVEL domain-containing protein n=1 Tax=Globodera pallida TaxID=36090 RepID=A0A183CKE5_GLOPA